MPAWLTFERVVFYSAQFGFVALATALLPRIFRMRDPKALEWLLSNGLAWATLLPFSEFLFQMTRISPPESGLTISSEAVAGAMAAPVRSGGLWILAAGAAAMLLWRLAGLVRLSCYRRTAQPIEPPELLGGETLQLHRRLGVEARYYLSDRVDGPLTYGVFSHAVIVPPRVLELPLAQRRAIVVHELLHARRKDWLGLLAIELERCLLWFHPAVHWFARQHARVREQAVDQESIELTADRESYLEALLEIARIPLRSDPAVAPLFLERNNLKQRVEIILEGKPMSKMRRVVVLSALSAALVGAALWISSALPLAAADSSTRVEIYKVGEGGVMAPRLIDKVEPAYSAEASEAKLEGTVILAVEVHPDGRIHNARVTKALGKGLDEQAIAAVERWRFSPALKDGKPVAVAATVEVNFRLK
jgi:TonB family protein